MDDENEDLQSALDRLERRKGVAEPERSTGAETVISPTLLSLPKERRPDPLPICAACPSSMWFASKDGLKAYCRVMHSLTWSSEEPEPILSCDGITLPMT